MRSGSRLLIAASCGLLLLAGCRSAAPGVGVSPPTPAESTARQAVEPWLVPAGEVPTLRLFRVRFEGPDGKGSFRLTSRLASPDHYQLQAADPLGRPLWTLYVAEGRGLLLDHRNETACTVGEDVELSQLWFGPLPAESLAAVLLGRLPAAPVAGALLVDRRDDEGVRHLEFGDPAGRWWRAEVASGEPRRWEMVRAGQVVVSSYEDPPWQVLEDHRRKLALRWRSVVREAFDGLLEPPAIPEAYALTDCLND